MASTSEMRAAWAPACDGGGMTTISYGDQGARITVDRVTVPIWRAVEAIWAKHNYGIRRADTGAYNCRQITGGSGYSLHAYGIAVDHNWQSNPYSSRLITDMPPAAIREIEALNVDGQPVLRWGGRYSGMRDAMHLEVIVPPAVAARFQAPQEGLTVADIDLIVQKLEKVQRSQRDLRKTQLSQGKVIRTIRAAQQGVTKAELDEIDADLDAIKAELGV